MVFDITARHPDYVRLSPTWQLMRDASEGEAAIKSQGERYLPMKSGIKAIRDARRQRTAYDNYKFRAEFPDIVAPTIRGSAGLVHKKESVIELPTALENLRDRATPDGLTLDELHNRVTEELLRVGRYGLMPGILDSGEMYLARYRAESIVNWDDQEGTPVYAVLDESAPVRDPETNKWAEREIYRECYVDELGGFVSRLWIKNADGEWQAGEEEFATVRGRDRLAGLPFVFVGAQDTTIAVDPIPLQGLARLACRAYVLDADYTNTLHMTSEPTPWITGVPQEQAPTTIGAATLWVLESELAKAGMLEFSGSGAGAQRAAIEDTLRRAMMFGAQLFADNTRSAESGEALETRLGHQTSPLRMIATASAAGLEKALQQAAVWAGADPEQVSVTPNLEFFDRNLSPQEITALVGGWMSGAYSKSTLFDNLKRGGIVDPDRTFEDEEAEMETENLLGGPTAEV